MRIKPTEDELAGGNHRVCARGPPPRALASSAMRTWRGAWHWGRPRCAARWEGETGPCGEKTRLLGKTRGFRGQQTLGTKVRARTGLCRGERSSCVLRPHDGPCTRDLGRRPSQSAFGEPVCPRGRWDTAWRAAAPFSPWAVSPRLRPGSGLLHCSAPAGPWPFSPVAALVGAPPSRPAALLRKLPVRGDPILDAVTCPPTEPRTGTRLQGAGPSHGGRLAGCAREGPDPAGRSGRAGECRRRDPGPRAGAALGHARGPGGLSCG